MHCALVLYRVSRMTADRDELVLIGSGQLPKIMTEIETFSFIDLESRVVPVFVVEPIFMTGLVGSFVYVSWIIPLRTFTYTPHRGDRLSFIFQPRDRTRNSGSHQRL